jgi:hypothetical protein
MVVAKPETCIMPTETLHTSTLPRKRLEGNRRLILARTDERVTQC